jgi:uncharacterized RmlC-like cupin family protein
LYRTNLAASTNDDKNLRLLNRHENAELAWYMVRGHINHILVTDEGKVETECGPGAAAYVKPGDFHQEINLSSSETAELIMAYTNPDNEDCNSLASLGTKNIE